MVSPLPFFICNFLVKWLFFGTPGPFLAFPCDTLQLFYRQNINIFDNNNKQDMIITTQKYQTINITKLLNTLNLNFIILNNKLIFTHKLTNQNLKDINKILKLKYNSCYKITK